MRQILPFKLLLFIAPGCLFAQAPTSPTDLRAELAARRVQVASQKFEKIKTMVEMGVEAKIRQDAAERDLEDAKDQAILETASSTEDAVLAAAQRRMDRLKAWTERVQKLLEIGAVPPVEVMLADVESTNRSTDLALAEARVRLKAEMLALAARTPRPDETAPIDAEEPDMEHYEGIGIFDEARDRLPLVKAFAAAFDHPLPISADGETDVHRALGFDHRGRIDVALDPRAPEGIWLRRYLRARRIPYYAFTRAIAGKATAAHIHIGPGSTPLPHPASGF